MGGDVDSSLLVLFEPSQRTPPPTRHISIPQELHITIAFLRPQVFILLSPVYTVFRHTH